MMHKTISELTLDELSQYILSLQKEGNDKSEMKHFLQKRRLLDEEQKDFGLNNDTKGLTSSIEPKPIAVFSFIPKQFVGSKLASKTFIDLKKWLLENNRGYYPRNDKELFNYYDFHYCVDGLIFVMKAGEDVYSYFKVVENGYVEMGLSSTIFGRNNNNQKTYLLLTRVIGLEMLLLDFSKHFYNYLGYTGEVTLQMSFANVSNCSISGFHSRYDNRYSFGETLHTQYEHFIVRHSYIPSELGVDDILKVAQKHDELLYGVFGFEGNAVFYNGEIDANKISF